MYAIIKITAGYTLNGVAASELEEYLEQALADAVGNGLLTGPHHEAEVDEYEISVLTEEDPS